MNYYDIAIMFREIFWKLGFENKITKDKIVINISDDTVYVIKKVGKRKSKRYRIYRNGQLIWVTKDLNKALRSILLDTTSLTKKEIEKMLSPVIVI